MGGLGPPFFVRARAANVGVSERDLPGVGRSCYFRDANVSVTRA